MNADRPLETISELIVDEWERTEKESMREGHRSTLERLIRARLEQVATESADRAAIALEARRG